MWWLKLIEAIIGPLFQWISKKFKQSTPLSILKKREEKRKEFERNLPKKDPYGTHGEAIIRDIKRMESYPNINMKEKGISSWFKVEIKGLYHKGIEVFLSSPQYITQNGKGEWIFAKDKNIQKKTLAYQVGRIPFEFIGYVNWDGDEYYNVPHIYCHFKGKRKQPYETIVYYHKELPNSNYLFEVEGFRPDD